MIARIATALVGIPIVLGACFYTHPSLFAVLCIFAGTLGLVEAFALIRQAGSGPVLSGLAALVWVAIPLLCLVGLQTAYMSGRHNEVWDVHTPLLLVFLPLWAGDTAAIFAGKAFGKHPLAPSISPNKTWEGAIANFAACVLAGWGAGHWIGIGSAWGVLVGVLAGVLGQTGDLYESWMKRKAGVKDSGSFLPGHGGILDRIDSLLFSAIPVTCVYFLIVNR